ncbi:MAG: SH3 domain-containing protein, partial [Verrucomicrobia bacterium]|nr:SH3 domain-containing protein [Verrucomicrobiota bacterium]
MIPTVRALALVGLLTLGALTTHAQRAARAEVRADRTNLRAQPSRDSEVLASLRRGELVDVLGEETSPGDKELWSRVALPSSVPVWIHSPGVDKAGVVKNEKIYFRAGPGKNYSVLGHLRRGNSVTILREFDGWLQISPPSGAVAFVASRLLASPGSVAPTNAPVPTPPVAAIVKATNAPPAPTRAALSPQKPATNAPPTPRAAPPMPPSTPSAESVQPSVRPAPVVPAPQAASTPPPSITPAPVAASRAPEPPAPAAVAANTAPAATPPDEEAQAPAAPRAALRGSPKEIASRSAAAPREFPLLASDPDPGRPTPEDAQVEPRKVTREGT